MAARPNRPLNEEDLFKEFEARFPGTSYLPLPPAALVDRQCLRHGRLIAYGESKSRNFPHGRYPTAVLDALKHYALIAWELDTGIPVYLYTSYADGVVTKVQPSQVGPLTISMLAPGRKAVSLNAGKSRPIVEYPADVFHTLFTVEGGSDKGTAPEPFEPGRFEPIPDDVTAHVEAAWGCDVRPMHNDHPLNAWCETNGRFLGWVDIRTVDAPSTGDAIPVAWEQFPGGMRHEKVFTNGESWLVVQCSDGVVLTVRPETVGSHSVTVETFRGKPLQTVAWIPRDCWVPLGERPF